jgi:DNA-binding GntR family transcriptional regulator
MKIEKLNTVRNLQAKAYEIIRNYVVRPEVPAGARLYEEKLSKEIGVSRTPVRIALSRLDREGLIRITPNRGTLKTHLSWEDASEVISIRRTIECLAIDMGKKLENDVIDKICESIPNVSFLEASGDSE